MHAMHGPLPGTHTAPPGTLLQLPGAEAALIGLAALGVVMIPLLWPLAEHFSVMAHEGAHAATGSLLGFSPLGVVLKADATGGTFFPPSMGGPRAVVTAAVGYLGPSLFGLGAAKLIESGRIAAVLEVGIILLVLLLFLIRKSFGIVSVPAAIALLALSIRYSHDGLEEVIVYGMTWVLLLSGVRVAVADGARASDAEVLSASTRIPRLLWALLWLGGTLLAVVISGKWLILKS
ncbi:MAG: M50 family metallopeptidase [Trebonia sp.]